MRSLLLPIMLMIHSISFSQSYATTLRCKDATNERVRKNCIIKEIQKFVDANYDIASVVSFALPGTNRIYARFRMIHLERLQISR